MAAGFRLDRPVRCVRGWRRFADDRVLLLPGAGSGRWHWLASRLVATGSTRGCVADLFTTSNAAAAATATTQPTSVSRRHAARAMSPWRATQPASARARPAPPASAECSSAQAVHVPPTPVRNAGRCGHAHRPRAARRRSAWLKLPLSTRREISWQFMIGSRCGGCCPPRDWFGK